MFHLLGSVEVSSAQWEEGGEKLWPALMLMVHSMLFPLWDASL